MAALVLSILASVSLAVVFATVLHDVFSGTGSNIGTTIVLLLGGGGGVVFAIGAILARFVGSRGNGYVLALPWVLLLLGFVIVRSPISGWLRQYENRARQTRWEAERRIKDAWELSYVPHAVVGATPPQLAIDRHGREAQIENRTDHALLVTLTNPQPRWLVPDAPRRCAWIAKEADRDGTRARPEGKLLLLPRASMTAVADGHGCDGVRGDEALVFGIHDVYLDEETFRSVTQADLDAFAATHQKELEYAAKHRDYSIQRRPDPWPPGPAERSGVPGEVPPQISIVRAGNALTITNADPRRLEVRTGTITAIEGAGVRTASGEFADCVWMKTRQGGTWIWLEPKQSVELRSETAFGRANRACADAGDAPLAFTVRAVDPRRVLYETRLK